MRQRRRILIIVFCSLPIGCSSWGNFWAGGNASASDLQNANTVPGAPTGLTFSTKTANSIALTWGAVAGATGYKVYRAATSGGALTLLASPTATNHGDTGLTASTSYFYKTSATNSLGEGPLSAEATIATYSIPNFVGMTPSDGATGVPNTTSIVLTFSEAINPSTVDATSGGPCAAQTILVSADSFVNCLGILASFSGGNTIITLPAPGLWPTASTIRVRITTNVQSANGIPVPTQPDRSFSVP